MNNAAATITYSRQKKGWPPARRRAQAERIRNTRPWEKSTGPKTPEGKARSSKNALKHCRRSAAFRRLMRALAAQRRWLRTFSTVPDGNKIKTNFPNSGARYKLVTMTDSGFSGLPPGPRTGEAAYPQGLAELKAKIVELRAEIKTERVRQRMEGEILRHNDDGTTVIKTGKGEVTVRLPPRERPPPGTKVEIDIPPGNPPGTPPRQVTIRPAPEAPPQDARPPPEQPSPAPAEKASAAQAKMLPPQAAPAPVTPPPRIDIRTAADFARYIETLPPQNKETAPLKQGDLIRLLPLPAAQAQDLVTRPEAAPDKAKLTALPQTPQIAPASSLFERLSPALSLPYAEHSRLASNLPSPLPLLTQLTAQPVPSSILETLPLAARAPVQQLVQSILQANLPDALRPFTMAPAPVTIAAPPEFAFAAPGDNPAMLKLPPGNFAPSMVLPAVKSGDMPFLIKTPATFFTAGPQSPLQTAAPVRDAFDVGIRAILPPPVRLLAAAEENIGKPQGAAIKNFFAPLHAGAQNPYAQVHPSAMPHPLPQSAAGSLTGEITGATFQNLPVINFFLPGSAAPQLFIMPFPATNLPQGAQVEVTPLPGKAAMAVPAANLPPFVPVEFFSSFSWPALDDLNRALQQAAPQAAQMLAGITASANAPARVPMAALFFLAAVRAGDVSGWLGERTVDTLRRLGKGDMISRLGRDMAGLQRTAEQPAGEWRATALPMMWQGELYKIMLFYRHDERETDDENDKRRGTRFIFDLQLTRMGAVQLDGLHRAQAGKARLDLIVRTKSALSAPMQQYMRGLYISALEESGLAGEISFQNRPEQFIRVDLAKKKETA